MTEFNNIQGAEVHRDVNNSWWEMAIYMDEPILDRTYVAREVDIGNDTAYFGVDATGIWVSAFVHSPDAETGYGGVEIPLTMDDGSIRKIKGPWSGRPALYMAYGFPPYDEVSVRKPGRGAGQIMGMTQAGVEAVLEKFHLPYHTEIGELYPHAGEDSLILVPNKEGK